MAQIKLFGFVGYVYALLNIIIAISVAIRCLNSFGSGGSIGNTQYMNFPTGHWLNICDFPSFPTCVYGCLFAEYENNTVLALKSIFALFCFAFAIMLVIGIKKV